MNRPVRADGKEHTKPYQEGLVLKQTVLVHLRYKSPGEPSGGSWGGYTGGTGPGTVCPWSARSSSSDDCLQKLSHPVSSPIPADWGEGYPVLPPPPRQLLTRGWLWCHESCLWLKKWWAGQSRSWDVLRGAWREPPLNGHQQWSLEEDGTHI